MTMHGFRVATDDQVFLANSDEEIGAVRQVNADHLVIYIENAGDFIVYGPQVQAAHDGKVILDPAKVEPKLLEAASTAHERETD
jgi:hypothetical protein